MSDPSLFIIITLSDLPLSYHQPLPLTICGQSLTLQEHHNYIRVYEGGLKNVIGYLEYIFFKYHDSVSYKVDFLVIFS